MQLKGKLPYFQFWQLYCNYTSITGLLTMIIGTRLSIAKQCVYIAVLDFCQLGLESWSLSEALK